MEGFLATLNVDSFNLWAQQTTFESKTQHLLHERYAVINSKVFYQPLFVKRQMRLLQKYGAWTKKDSFTDFFYFLALTYSSTRPSPEPALRKLLVLFKVSWQRHLWNILVGDYKLPTCPYSLYLDNKKMDLMFLSYLKKSYTL